jgi:Fe-S oxidoreductase
MLPLAHKIAFLAFAAVAVVFGAQGFYGVYRRIRAGRPDPEPRFDAILSRVRYALWTTLMQRRTFRKRPAVSFFHALIFYGFIYYLLVNFVDGAEGYLPVSISSAHWAGAAYNLFADILSACVLVGVVALIARRFLLPARRDFRFNPKIMLHERVRKNAISRDSVMVSCFILFHVGSRAAGAGARLAAEGQDRFQPFASLLSHAFSPADAAAWRVFGYWGALGSVLAFLAYFPYSKHIHLFMAPIKYLTARRESSGVLPWLEVKLDASGLDDSGAEGEQKLGAGRLEQLAWPRLLDAYACIQCNRCQDVCPATVTMKSLSPAALEINKRMELNQLAARQSGFERAGFAKGEPSPRPLLEFALSPEAAWACTTCGACMQVCPVQNEQMLDIIDIRRHQVMMEGEFPAQLQSAFRGMERANNPWGINHEQRMAWAEGLDVPTIEEKPDADILYWAGCAPSYDPQSQKTARAFVQLLDHAGVSFAVLGKKECCTGDSARRAGNEYLYQQLAERNMQTLDTAGAKTIVTTCPHCMNAIGHEYKQLGGNYKVLHHTELLASLVAEGKLNPSTTDQGTAQGTADQGAAGQSITYHDPCYLGRHNGVYDAPRNLLRVLSNDFVELPRNRENAFCCGAGGAQFWKEEEPGPEKITSNRFSEVEKTLADSSGQKVLAVGCPFCKSMLGSTPSQASHEIQIRDVAELLFDNIFSSSRLAEPLAKTEKAALEAAVSAVGITEPAVFQPAHREEAAPLADPEPNAAEAPNQDSANLAAAPSASRKKWSPKRASTTTHSQDLEERPPSGEFPGK